LLENKSKNSTRLVKIFIEVEKSLRYSVRQARKSIYRGRKGIKDRESVLAIESTDILKSEFDWLKLIDIVLN